MNERWETGGDKDTNSMTRFSIMLLGIGLAALLSFAGIE